MRKQIMVHQQSFRVLRQRYAQQSLSPVDVTASALAHARRVDERLNAFALIDEEGAMAAAQASARRWEAGQPLGPLDGMPLTIKEFAAVQGWPTRRGSLTTSDAPAALSTVFVQRLQQAGAVLLGKTRAPEFNWKGLTDSPGFGITRNPWDTRLTPGGSSGGCAAVVASGVVRVSMGSDAGGSVRIPAAFTGTLGLKPTYGRIPQSPVPSAFSGIVHTGPIAADAVDMHEVMRVVSGPASADWSSWLGRDIGPDVLPRSDRLRIGVLSSKYLQDCAEPVVEAFERMAAALQQAGHEMVECDHDIAAASEVGAYFYRIGCAASVRAVDPERRALLDQGLLDFVATCADETLPDYLQYCQRRDRHAAQLMGLLNQVDVLMSPTTPILAFEAGRLTPSDWHSTDWMSWNPFTPAFNVAQLPALSYPVWPEDGALPAGIQFVAGKLGEARLMGLARRLQDSFPIRLCDH